LIAAVGKEALLKVLKIVNNPFLPEMIAKSLSVNNFPPFVKGGVRGDFFKASRGKSPYVPLFQRGI
jgi:hypothetical protein